MIFKDNLKVKLSEIKTPTTLEEFRDNLKKYFAGWGEDELYVKPSVGNAYGIKYKDINSLEDIYKITGDHSPSITPLIEYKVDELKKHMQKTNQTFSSNGFFHDDYEVFENTATILMQLENPAWFTLDNQIIREFYVKVLGDFSGYVYSKVEKVA